MNTILDNELYTIYDREDARVGLDLLHRKALCTYVDMLEEAVRHHIFTTVGIIKDKTHTQYNFKGETRE